MVLVVLAVNGDEVGVGHAQLRRLVVHELGEGFGGPGQLLRDGDGGVVAGGEHESVEQIPDGPLLTGFQPHEGVILLVEVDGVFGDGGLLVQPARFDGQHAGEDLDGAARGTLGIGVLFDAVEGGGGVGGIHQNGVPLPQGPHVKIVRPGRRGGQKDHKRQGQ